MKISMMMVLILFVVAQNPAQCKGHKSKTQKETSTMVKAADEFKVLPDGAKLDDEVRVQKKDDQGNVVSSETITVKEKLKRLGAGYQDGVLVDKGGKEIHFYKRQFRGTSEGLEADERFRKAEDKRLADLKENFTVIEIYVNPLKIM